MPIRRKTRTLHVFQLAREVLKCCNRKDSSHEPGGHNRRCALNREAAVSKQACSVAKIPNLQTSIACMEKQKQKSSSRSPMRGVAVLHWACMALVLLATKAVIVMLADRLVSIIQGVIKGTAVGVAIPIAMLHLVTKSQRGTFVKAVGDRIRTIWGVHHPTFTDTLALHWINCWLRDCISMINGVRDMSVSIIKLLSCCGGDVSSIERVCFWWMWNLSGIISIRPPILEAMMVRRRYPLRHSFSVHGAHKPLQQVSVVSFNVRRYLSIYIPNLLASLAFCSLRCVLLRPPQAIS